MLGRVADIQRFCMHDGPGIRTVVFLQGCPLRCAYCHNPEMQSADHGTLMSTETVVSDVERDLPFFKASSGGITLSGGEPLMQADFSEALLKKAKSRGLHTCVETSGAGRLCDLERLAFQTDIFLWDVKFADESAEAPMEKLKAIEKTKAKIWLRSVLLQGANAQTLKERLQITARAVKSCERIEILPFNALAEAKK